MTSYRFGEPERPPPVLAIEVVSSGHPYKDYSWVHEGYAAMGALELLVFDPLLLGPKSLGPVTLQLWRRDLTGAFERVHFGDTAEAAQSRAEAAQSKAEAERERAQRLELEAKLRKLEGR